MTSTTAPCLPGRIYLREPPPSSRHGLALSQLGITVIQSIEICSWAKDRLLALGFDPTVKMLSSVAAGIKETLVLEIITKYDDDFTCPDEEDKKYNVNALVNVIVHQLRDKFYPGRAGKFPFLYRSRFVVMIT